MKRKLTLLTLLAVLLMSFAVVAHAEDEIVLPTIEDGRINEFDIDAPVAVYAYYDYPYADDVNMGVLNRIEFWGITSAGTIDKVLEVTGEDIQNADNLDGSVVVASAYSYTLYKEADGSLTIVAPTSTNGIAYVFNWEQTL